MLMKPKAATASKGRDRYHREREVATIRAKEIYQKLVDAGSNKLVIIVYDAHQRIYTQFRRLVLKSDLSERVKNPWVNQYTFSSMFDTTEGVHIGVRELVIENTLLVFAENPATFFRMQHFCHLKEDLSRIQVKYYSYTYLIDYSYYRAANLVKYVRKYFNTSDLNIFVYDPLDKIRYEFKNAVENDRVLKIHYDDMVNGTLFNGGWYDTDEKRVLYYMYKIKRNRIVFVEELTDYFGLMYSTSSYIREYLKVKADASDEFVY